MHETYIYVPVRFLIYSLVNGLILCKHFDSVQLVFLQTSEVFSSDLTPSGVIFGILSEYVSFVSESPENSTCAAPSLAGSL